MGRKLKLSDLVQEETKREEVEEEGVESGVELEEERVRGEIENPRERKKLSGKREESKMMPKYLQLVRKEARLRNDQLDELTLLARELNRQKEGGERITENTLIRVAVDLLLEKKGQLAGEDEDKLRESLK